MAEFGFGSAEAALAAARTALGGAGLRYQDLGDLLAVGFDLGDDGTVVVQVQALDAAINLVVEVVADASALGEAGEGLWAAVLRWNHERLYGHAGLDRDGALLLELPVPPEAVTAVSLRVLLGQTVEGYLGLRRFLGEQGMEFGAPDHGASGPYSDEPERLMDLAIRAYRAHLETANIAALRTAVDAARRAVGLLAAGDERLAGSLNNLAAFLGDLARISDPGLLAEAIGHARRAVELTREDSPDLL